MASVDSWSATDRRSVGVLLVAVALTTLALPWTCEAQVAFCPDFDTAFPQCQCRGALDSNPTLDLVLDCSNQGLTSVPAPAPGSVLPNLVVIHELILANNSIAQLGADSFRGLRARSLDLSGNALDSVHSDAFLPLAGDLRELQIDGNLTNTPPKSALAYLDDLEILTLRDYSVSVLGDPGHMYFLRLTNLRYLTLQQWQIGSIEPEAFVGPSSLLSLTIANEQDLVGLPLAPLNDDSLKSLTTLKISATQISEVTDSAFSKLEKLTELDLSNNFIQKIKSNSLRGLGPTLKKLSFASNHLVSTDSVFDGLSDLPHLEELDLSGNENINVVPDLSRLNLNEQTSIKVFLDNNEIKSLSPNTFSGIAERLHTLDLSNNKITSMDQDSFSGVTNLQVLRLSQQSGLAPGGRLAIPDSLSQSAGSLSHLFLDGQALDEGSLTRVLPHLTKLEVLDLNYCGLTSIPTLQRMTALRELYLAGNSLTSLDQDHLIGPRSTLKRLDLSQNPLQRISSCVFAHYTSFPITLTLPSASLICDCWLRWLQRQANAGNIIFSGDAPVCSDNVPLLSKPNSEICSNADYTDPPCEDPYATPAPTTTPGPPSLTVTVGTITSTSLILSWTVSGAADRLRSFNIRISNSFGDSEYVRDDIAPRTFQIEATPLLPDTQHTVCVIANFQFINSVTKCTTTRTERGDGTGPQGQTGDDSNNTGVIIGAVVGAVLLLVVLAAIVYLVFVRRTPKKGSDPAPVQPRNFTKSELPSMTDDSRTFTRPKRPLDHHDGMQVVAISDGQVNDRHSRNGSGRVGRAAMLQTDGSYKLMSAGASSADDTSASSVYENDHGLLPKTPPYYDRGLRGPRQPGYYNEAFEKDKYDEIEMQREVTL